MFIDEFWKILEEEYLENFLKVPTNKTERNSMTTGSVEGTVGKIEMDIPGYDKESIEVFIDSGKNKLYVKSKDEKIDSAIILPKNIKSEKVYIKNGRLTFEYELGEKSIELVPLTVE